MNECGLLLVSCKSCRYTTLLFQYVSFGTESKSFMETVSVKEKKKVCSTVKEPLRYKRHISLPRTHRERVNYIRDHHYARYRPSIDLPWCQSKRRTFIDDAERLYGRKENWHTLPDLEIKEKLLMLLKDYYRDLTAATRAELRSAHKYEKLCRCAAEDYRKHIAEGAFNHTEILRLWAQAVLQGRRVEDRFALQTMQEENERLLSGKTAVNTNEHAKIFNNLLYSSSDKNDVDNRNCGDDDDNHDHDDDDDDDDNNKHNNKVSSYYMNAQEKKHNTNSYEKMRDIGNSTLYKYVKEREQLPFSNDILENDFSSGLTNVNMSTKENTVENTSTFPFLRKRAVEHGETLDPSLLSWTTHHYPEDNTKTFAEPPQLRSSLAKKSTQGKNLHSSTALSQIKSEQSKEEFEEQHQHQQQQQRQRQRQQSEIYSSKLFPLNEEEKKGQEHLLQGESKGTKINAFRRLRHSLKQHDDHYRATFDGEGAFYHVRNVNENSHVNENDIGSSDEVQWRIPRSLCGSELTKESLKRLQNKNLRSSHSYQGRIVKVPWDVAAKAQQQGYSSEILRARERLIRLTRGENPESIP